MCLEGHSISLKPVIGRLFGFRSRREHSSRLSIVVNKVGHHTVITQSAKVLLLRSVVPPNLKKPRCFQKTKQPVRSLVFSHYVLLLYFIG
jgi:hypothetical protein